MCDTVKSFLLSMLVFLLVVFGLVISASGKENKINVDYLGKSENSFCSNRSTIYISKLCVDGYTYIVVQDGRGISITQSMYHGIKGILPYRCENTTNEEESNDEK